MPYVTFLAYPKDGSIVALLPAIEWPLGFDHIITGAQRPLYVTVQLYVSVSPSETEATSEAAAQTGSLPKS